MFLARAMSSDFSAIIMKHPVIQYLLIFGDTQVLQFIISLFLVKYLAIMGYIHFNIVDNEKAGDVMGLAQPKLEIVMIINYDICLTSFCCLKTFLNEPAERMIENVFKLPNIDVNQEQYPSVSILIHYICYILFIQPTN